MRPYWTILRDAFREALVSRVLWVLLVLITLVLLSLAPLGYRMDLVTEFSTFEFRDAKRFVQNLRREFEADEPLPGHRIWSLFDQPAQEELTSLVTREVRGRERFRTAQLLTEQLNKLVHRRDLYDADSWEDATIRSELRELLDREADSLSDLELARRNRLLLEANYRDQLQSRPRESIIITYAMLDMTPGLPLTKSQMDSLIERVALTLLMNLLLGWVALIAGILVTAPIIPQMFQPGSLHLLLSKPVSRSLLYVTRVLGGCAFVFVCVTYLVVGLWIIAGWRFGIWNQGMLKCIPVFLFLFVIYYVVSALIGAIWRNAVVAVVLTIAFSFLCNALNTSKGIIESFFVEPLRIVNLVEAGDKLIAVDERGVTKQWNEERRDWDDIFLNNGPPGGVRTLGPVYDSEGDRLMAARLRNAGFGGMVMMGSNLQVAVRDNGWQRTDGPSLPRGTFALLQDADGKLLAIGDEGVFRLDRLPDDDSPGVSLFGFQLPMASGPEFERVGPASMNLNSPAAAAREPASGNLAIYHEGIVDVLRRGEKGRYENLVSRELPSEENDNVVLAYAGETVVVARTDGKLLLLNEETLEPRTELQPVERSQPRFLSASPDGNQVAIVYQDGQVWMLDVQGGHATRPRVDGQGDVSAAVFDRSGQLLVASHGTRVASYDAKNFARQQSWRPNVSRIEWIYEWILMPIYTVFPKPAELNNTIQYLLTDETTVDLPFVSGDAQSKRQQLEPWAPVWSGAAFIVVVLGIACFYIERQEF
ncbi:MAG: ABC transporter permease [Planctomycetales bacterium]|nr:ABC transporter permease [Planctomycetales bacterium]